MLSNTISIIIMDSRNYTNILLNALLANSNAEDACGSSHGWCWLIQSSRSSVVERLLAVHTGLPSIGEFSEGTFGVSI